MRKLNNILMRENDSAKGYVAESDVAERGWSVGDDILLTGTTLGHDVKITVIPDGLFRLYSRSRTIRERLKPLSGAQA